MDDCCRRYRPAHVSQPSANEGGGRRGEEGRIMATAERTVGSEHFQINFEPLQRVGVLSRPSTFSLLVVLSIETQLTSKYIVAESKQRRCKCNDVIGAIGRSQWRPSVVTAQIKRKDAKLTNSSNVCSC